MENVVRSFDAFSLRNAPWVTCVSALLWLFPSRINFSSMQHLDFEPVQTERPGELIAYYKIARK